MTGPTVSLNGLLCIQTRRVSRSAQATTDSLRSGSRPDWSPERGNTIAPDSLQTFLRPKGVPTTANLFIQFCAALPTSDEPPRRVTGDPRRGETATSSAVYPTNQLVQNFFKVSSWMNNTLALSCGRFWRGLWLCTNRDRADCQLERLVSCGRRTGFRILHARRRLTVTRYKAANYSSDSSSNRVLTVLQVAVSVRTEPPAMGRKSTT